SRVPWGRRGGWQTGQPRLPRSTVIAFPELLRGLEDVVHRGLDLLVRQRQITAPRGHQTHAVEGRSVQTVLALADAAAPLSGVADLGRAHHAGAVAGRTGLVEDRFARD